MRKLVGVLLAASIMANAALSPWAAARIPRGRLGVGDSIMLSASDELLAYDIPVAAKVGRQFSEGARIVRRKARDGTLPKDVIVHLGTNGWIDPAECDSVVAAAGPRRRVYLVTIHVPREWMDPNNEILESCAASSDTAYLLPWASVSGRHPEWFAKDGYHLNAIGQEKYATYLDTRVDAILAR